MLLSVSLLNSKDKKKDTLELNSLGIDYFHIDVMDGKFVSQKSFPFKEVKEVSQISNKPLDVHLMMQNPRPYIRKLRKLTNINNITIHLELPKVKENLLLIKNQGIKCGLSIKPNTDIELLKPYLDIVDMILIMTVEPGLGGQPFIKESPERITKIKELIDGYNILLEVDGGINNNTIKEVTTSDIAVVGSYITTSDNKEERIKSLLV